ncbi:MAG: integration host factor, beta subunit [Pseudomonadota bacterium]
MSKPSNHWDPEAGSQPEPSSASIADTSDIDASSIAKSELITKLAEKYPQLAARDAELAVRTLLDAMTRTLVEGRRIEIRGFGSFALSTRPPRTGRNPKSGETVMVPEKRVPHFKPGKELRKRVDLGPGDDANGPP